MTDYVVFEETKSAEFSCQTDEISLDSVETQTVEETISEYNNDEEDHETAYWAAIVANRKLDVERIREINEKLEAEKTEKLASLETKKAEYKRLFDLGNEKLNESRTDESEVDTTAEDPEKR